MPTKKQAKNEAQQTVAEVKAKSQEAVNEVKKFSKEAYEKGSVIAKEGADITKANAQALMTSGQIIADGMKDLTQTNVDASRKAIDTLGEDMKTLADIKSPAALFEMQGKVAARNYDAMVDYVSKTSSMMGDYAKKAFAPIQARTKATYEEISKAA